MSKGLLKPNPKTVQAFPPCSSGIAAPMPVHSESRPVVSSYDLAYGKDDMISESVVMEWLGVTKQWLADHRTRVEPIIPHLLLGKEIRYSRSEVNGWLRQLVETRPRWERQKQVA
jgi:hypothetical protein